MFSLEDLLIHKVGYHQSCRGLLHGKVTLSYSTAYTLLNIDNSSSSIKFHSYNLGVVGVQYEFDLNQWEFPERQMRIWAFLQKK